MMEAQTVGQVGPFEGSFENTTRKLNMLQDMGFIAWEKSDDIYKIHFTVPVFRLSVYRAFLAKELGLIIYEVEVLRAAASDGEVLVTILAKEVSS